MIHVTDCPSPAATAGDLADRLVATVVAGLSAFEESSAPSLMLPGLFAGHPVRDDTRSDLLYVMGMLIEAGVDNVAGVDLRGRARELLGEITPSEIEGFYSYRVAETVLRLGGLDALPRDLRVRAVEASRSPRLMSLLSSPAVDMYPNYCVVAARCLSALTDLEERDSDPQLARLVDHVRAMFAATRSGWVNDGKPGRVQFDIYTPDMYLLAEPLVDDLGETWKAGFASVIGDLDDLSHPKGAVVWGRSIGALAQAMTIEIGSAATRWELGGQQGRWLARIPGVLRDLEGWFPRGVISAHQGRSTDAYRGPQRRLQMTLDVYGKLMLSALSLRRCPETRLTCDPDAMWPPIDRLIRFEVGGTAAAWVHRSRHLSFVLPLMHGYSAEYLPTPRSPNLLEQPLSGHPVMIPTLARRRATGNQTDAIKQLVPAGLPTEIAHEPGCLIVQHTGWAPIGGGPEHPDAIAGSRTAVYRIHGRTLDVEEHLNFPDSDPGLLSISIGERKDRPLDVRADIGGPPMEIDTSGIAEWRSCWGELTKVYQIELPRCRSLEFTWSVTPRLRVASTDYGHQYNQSLYGPIGSQVVALSAGIPDETLTERLRDVDLLHVAWPERWSGVDPALTKKVIDQVRAAGTRIVWTQHNLLPHHHKDEAATATYAHWAASADTVIHHSRYGKRIALSTYKYGHNTKHVVIPHGHWGAQYEPFRHATRAEVEREEGWPPCEIRLAVIGQPRAEKELQLVVDAVAACGRGGLQLVARVSPTVNIPKDDRIIAEYGHLTYERFHRRMMAFDGIILPFAENGMLTTGTAFDCIGAGVAAITSDWEFLDETFAGGDIRYGSSVDALRSCLDRLTEAQLRASRDAMVDLRPRYEWNEIASRTLAVLEETAVADVVPSDVRQAEA